MTTRTTTILVLLMILGAIVAGALLWNQLPEQMFLLSFWGLSTEVSSDNLRLYRWFLKHGRRRKAGNLPSPRLVCR